MNSADALLEQFEIRIYKESIPRIITVLDMLTQEQIWYSPNENANSIGNLILHLCGNVTQWIGSGIGGRKDDRKRDQEFSTEQNLTSERLKMKLEHLRTITTPALAAVSEETLLEKRTVQGFEETSLSIIVHVIEHFSYHTGQIAIIAKYLTNQDLGFYADMNLNITN